MQKIFNYTFEVRGYELDSFGHVNNAVYLNYLEQARWEIINQLGLLTFFKKTGNFMVVIESRIKYINELNIFDQACVETKMGRLGFFIEFNHDVFTQDKKKKIAKAKIKCLFVDRNRNPLDIPAQILPYLSDVPDSKMN